MKVLIFSATGFISQPAALAFVRAGHIVYGTTRSEESGKLLAKLEIIPVVCDATSEAGRQIWEKLVGEVDVVLDSTPAVGSEVPLKTFKHTVSKVADRPAGAALTYIYCGGSWVHSRGTGGLDSWTDERQPHSGQNKLTAWRWDVEKEVLASKDVHGIVVRPPVMYGTSGSLMVNMAFKPAMESAKTGETFETVGNKDTRFLTVHHDDLADLFLRVAERAPICKGQAFVAANPHSERYTDILDAVVRVSGAKGYALRAPDERNPFEIAWASTTNLKPSLAHALTGWVPRKMGLVDGMDIYWASFKANLQ
ncbi:hypothetical protein P7C73_g3378, partial [Tremellales sp. Uapishka_1]